jgi:hypothetical protein
LSAAGSQLASEPPTVPRWRTCGSPITPASTASLARPVSALGDARTVNADAQQAYSTQMLSARMRARFAAKQMKNMERDGAAMGLSPTVRVGAFTQVLSPLSGVFRSSPLAGASALYSASSTGASGRAVSTALHDRLAPISVAPAAALPCQAAPPRCRALQPRSPARSSRAANHLMAPKAPQLRRRSTSVATNGKAVRRLWPGFGAVGIWLPFTLTLSRLRLKKLQRGEVTSAAARASVGRPTRGGARTQPDSGHARPMSAFAALLKLAATQPCRLRPHMFHRSR